MAKKKILIVVRILSTGGITSSLKALMQTSFSRDNEVTILTLSKNGIEQCPELSRHIKHAGTLSHLWYTSMLGASLQAKLLALPIKIVKKMPWIGKKVDSLIERRTARRTERKIPHDVVIAFAEDTAPKIVRHFSTANRIVWLHCDYGNRIKHDNENLLKKFSTIVCVSDFTRDSLLNRYPSLEGKVTSIYNICSIENIKAKANEKIDDNRFKTTDFTIISVGRVAKVKRFPQIPQIAKKLRDCGITFKWYIIGSGNSEETEKVKTAIESYGMQDEVIMLGAKSNPYPYFKAADLLVSTSESEACPMIFNEAKILGTPIVSTNFGSSYEFIKEGRDGIISSLDNLHNAIAKIATKDNYNSYSPKIDEELKEYCIVGKINKILDK